MSGAKDLLEFIDWSCLECLNEQHAHPATNVLKQGYREDDGLFLESDTDEQLLLNIHFNQKVRVHSITIKGPEEDGPKVVKLYTNRMSLGFSDADSMPCAQQLDLSPKELAGEPISLKLTKCDILSILIDSNQSDADTTKVFKISFAGQAGDTFNVAEIKKQEEQG
ncbi:galactose-binding domain-like protein [Scenedesmus sp. NREL 46B-D3]|nr:galactose-binding domain-like protein [Scenedesmus sp. NREL 46B-D3]